MARRRGWVGDPPNNDEEAAERIVAAAVKLMAQRGTAVSIAEVAAEIGVIRQTVYRYFPTADALMKAAAFASVDDFFDQLAAAVRGITDPADAMVEGCCSPWRRWRAPASGHAARSPTARPVMSPRRPRRASGCG